MNKILGCIHCIARPDLYSIEQWFALAFSVICLAADIFAIFLTAGGSTFSFGSLSVNTSGHEAVLWTAEVLLVIAVLCLLSFAFSRRPEDSQIR
jgi:hypothetical protein